MRRTRFRSLWVVALLAVLLSYSFDFECLLEAQGCQQDRVLAQADSDCAQTGLMPVVAVLLPCHIVITAPSGADVPRPVRITLVLEPLAQPPLSVPLGLRAPPLV